MAPGRRELHRRQGTALVLLAVLAAAALGAIGGFFAGRNHSWSYLDAATIERRLREVYCEQSIRNSVLKTCDPTFARSYE